MSVIWKAVNEWMLGAGAGAFWAKAVASGTCALALISAASAVCAALVFVLRRFVGGKNGSRTHKGNISAFIRLSVWFGFAWILAAGLPDAVKAFPGVALFLSRALGGISVVLGAAVLSSAVTCLHSASGGSSGTKIFASKTLVQMLKVIIWFVAAIVAVSALMGKSPAFVLSGLGALTAVFMLVFRDSLLGVVAGVQLSQNDMVRIGDWITMPKYNADGNVIDIALTTVKVQNFDNTVTMIPSSALISDSFINWRYMSVSKGRRIKRPVWISVTSVREMTGAEREGLVSGGLLSENDRPVSNLAAFETWLRRMLADDDRITGELTRMVRQTDAGSTGIPVEVYAFTKTRDWVEYEMIQTEIFDRIFVAVPKFGLQVYQRSGDKAG